jgi:hypothetical protein
VPRCRGLAFAKDFPGTRDRQHRRVWEHRETERVAGTVTVIVGIGPIGRAIARLLRALGMHVHGVGRTARDDDPDFGTVAAAADLARLLPEADYVVLAAPLTEQTRGMLGAAELEALRPTSRLINVGRGEPRRRGRPGRRVAGRPTRRCCAGRVRAGATAALVATVGHARSTGIAAHGGRHRRVARPAGRAVPRQPAPLVRRRAAANIVDKKLGYVPTTLPEESP